MAYLLKGLLLLPDFLSQTLPSDLSRVGEGGTDPVGAKQWGLFGATAPSALVLCL